MVHNPLDDLPYPSEGLDVAWLGMDKDGYLAAFLTGGWAPVPVSVLRSGGLSILEIEPLIMKMRVVARVCLFDHWPEPTSFIALAERGMFVYDWADPPASTYTIAAAPDLPCKIGELSGALASAAIPRLSRIRFAAHPAISIRDEVECQESQGPYDVSAKYQ